MLLSKLVKHTLYFKKYVFQLMTIILTWGMYIQNNFTQMTS